MFLPLLLLACGLGTACSETASSTSFTTDEIDATISVTSVGDDEIRVRADLDEVVPDDDSDFIIAFPPSPIELKGDDRLVAYFDDRRKRLRRNDLDLGFGPVYETVFRTDDPTGLVQVVFLRSNREVVDEPVVFLRPGFDVVEPAEGTLYGFDDAVLVAWTPTEPGERMHVTLRLRCTDLDGSNRTQVTPRTVADAGAWDYDLSGHPFATDPDIDPDVDCSLELDLERRETVDISPPFGDGVIVSRQIRQVANLTVRF